MGQKIIGVTLNPDWKMDARITSMVEYWDRDEDKESHYIPAECPANGRDAIVFNAMYRIPKPTHILFLDADVLPRRNTLKRLLDHDKDIITGVYNIGQQGKLYWNVSKSDTFNAIELEELPDNPFKVTLCGNGVMLVKTEVFERLEWPYWENIRSPGCIKQGEDLYFCKKARDAGYDIWCDPKVKCNHVRMSGLLSIANEQSKLTKGVKK
jgi:hypothetical protein